MPSFFSIQFCSLFSMLLVAYPMRARLGLRWEWVTLGISVWIVGGFFEPAPDHWIALAGLSWGTWAYAHWIRQTNTPGRRLTAGITLWVGLLALVKYPVLCSSLGLGTMRAFLLGTEPLAPVRFFGLSFLVFRSIHILADSASGALPRASLVQVTNYLLFFPTFLCGPLERFQTFTRQLAEPAPPSAAELAQALFRIALGLLKKTLLLEGVARFTVFGRAGWTGAPSAEILLGAYASLLYVYVDLSAYSDLAIGVSRFLGIRITENFAGPFLSTSVQDFWSRWHITLTNWIRDYIYTPILRGFLAHRGLGWTLTGSAVATILSFFVMAIWHGEGWAFALFGLLQGGIITLQVFYRTYLSRRHGAFYTRLRKSRYYLALCWVLTLHWMSFSMLLFLEGLRAYV